MADKKISALTAATTPLAGTEVLPIVQSASTVKVAVNDMLGVTSWTSPAVNSEGNMFLRATDTLATGVGTQIGLGGKYNATSYFPFGAVAGRKENATNNNVAGYLAFLTTTSGGTLTERARFNSTGNLAFSAAGTGIDFSANTHAAGMTSELLTWYEEGNWTPTLAFGGASTGITYALQVGRYTRVGRTVSVQAYLQLSAAGSATGAMTIEGLPFASANVSNYVCIGSCALDNAATSQNQPLARLNSNSTSIMVMGGTATDNWFQWTDSGILSASLRVFVSLTYTV